MVYHDHDRIEPIGDWEIGDKIHGEERKWSGVLCRDWLEWGVRWVSVYLMLLAEGASFHIILHKCGKSWPPIVPLDELLSLELSRVSC